MSLPKPEDVLSGDNSKPLPKCACCQERSAPWVVFEHPFCSWCAMAWGESPEQIWWGKHWQGETAKGRRMTDLFLAWLAKERAARRGAA